MGGPMLELDDIQSGVLRPRPTPYVATYVLCRIDERVDLHERSRHVLAETREFPRRKVVGPGWTAQEWSERKARA